MLVGLDFDNTIAGYDRLFVAAAREWGLVPAHVATKTEVSDHLRRRGAEGERDWQRLQGQVYGARMAGAELITGVAAFLERCRARSVPVAIISHKTEFGHFDAARVNLREAARAWMVTNGFFDQARFALRQDRVFFEATREEKVARIRILGCSHFVDDLEEVLCAPGFPETTRRWLLASGRDPLPQGPFRAHTTWDGIADDILGPA